MKTKIRDLRPGDLVDLEADPYADPHHDDPALLCELVMVACVERETEDCWLVGFEGRDPCGFPPDHEIEVDSHDDRYDEGGE